MGEVGFRKSWVKKRVKWSMFIFDHAIEQPCPFYNFERARLSQEPEHQGNRYAASRTRTCTCSPMSPTSTAMEDISCWYSAMRKSPCFDYTPLIFQNLRCHHHTLRSIHAVCIYLKINEKAKGQSPTHGFARVENDITKN